MPAVPKRLAAAPILAVLLVAAAAHAGPMRVEENASMDMVHAERWALPGTFEVAATLRGTSLLDLPAAGTADSPVEISEVPPPARTAIGAGNETYTVLVQERGANTVTSGAYVVQLTLDGAPLGEIHLVQDVADPLVREGVRATFDLGRNAPVAALAVVTVRRVVADVTAYALRSAWDGQDHVWVGTGGDAEGQTNPRLAAIVGTGVEFRFLNGDGLAPHNLVVLDESRRVVAGPAPDAASLGDSSTLSWTPESSGLHRYECQYHSGMAGDIDVT